MGSSLSHRSEESSWDHASSWSPTVVEHQQPLGNGFAQEQQRAHGASDTEPARTEGRLVGSDLDRDRPVGGEVPAEIRTRLMFQLYEAPILVDCLAAIQDATGHLTIPLRWSERGSYHQAGTIFLDRSGTMDRWIPTMMHELEHLRTYVCGESPDISNPDKAAYVQGMIDGEIRAHSQTYVALLQRGATSSPTAGFDQFLADLSRQHPELWMMPEEGEEDAHWQEVRNVASAWLVEKYKNEWKTSDTGLNYYEHYGREWERHHRGR